jgi:hypothetical protein
MGTGVVIYGLFGGPMPYLGVLFRGNRGKIEGKMAVFCKQTAFFENKKWEKEISPALCQQASASGNLLTWVLNCCIVVSR